MQLGMAFVFNLTSKEKNKLFINKNQKALETDIFNSLFRVESFVL